MIRVLIYLLRARRRSPTAPMLAPRNILATSTLDVVRLDTWSSLSCRGARSAGCCGRRADRPWPGASCSFVVGLPSLLSMAFARHRRREKGFDALSRGLIAAGAGDARAAGRASDPGRASTLRDHPARLDPEARRRRVSAAIDVEAPRRRSSALGAARGHPRARASRPARRGETGAATTRPLAISRARPTSADAACPGRRTRCWSTAPPRAIGKRRLPLSRPASAANLIDRVMPPTGNGLCWKRRMALRQGDAVSPDAALALARCRHASARRTSCRPVALAARLLTPTAATSARRRKPHRERLAALPASRPRARLPRRAAPVTQRSDRLARAQALMRICLLCSGEPADVVGARGAGGQEFHRRPRGHGAARSRKGQRPTRAHACLLMADTRRCRARRPRPSWREWLARASRAAARSRLDRRRHRLRSMGACLAGDWASSTPFVWQAPADRPRSRSWTAMPAPPAARADVSCEPQAETVAASRAGDPRAGGRPTCRRPRPRLPPLDPACRRGDAGRAHQPAGSSPEAVGEVPDRATRRYRRALPRSGGDRSLAASNRYSA